MLETLKEKIFKDKDCKFVSLISSVIKDYTSRDNYDQYTSSLIESYILNDCFINREEIALYLAFHLHSTRIFKSNDIFDKESELKKIYETSEKASKDIITKAKELGYKKIFDKIDLQQDFKLNQMNRIDFFTYFFKRFDKHSDLIASKKDVIRVYFPNEMLEVLPDPLEFKYVDVSISRTDLPIGFLRTGFEYCLINQAQEDDILFKTGLRSVKRMKEWLVFRNELDYINAFASNDDWSFAINR